MPDAPPPQSIRTGVRRLIETYTPDGALGRVGLSAVAGPVGIYALMLAVGFLVNPWIASVLVVPVAAVAGVFLTVVTVLTLWPVYLSAIGRIDAASEYRNHLETVSESDRQSQAQADASATEQLKTRYRQGELSEEAFERELERALSEDGHGTDERPEPTDGRYRDNERVRETEEGN